MFLRRPSEQYTTLLSNRTLAIHYSLVWEGLHGSELAVQLQKLQNRAAMILTLPVIILSSGLLLQELGWNGLSKRALRYRNVHSVQQWHMNTYAKNALKMRSTYRDTRGSCSIAFFQNQLCQKAFWL